MNKILLVSLIGAVLSIPSIAQPATIGNIAGMQGTSGRYSLGIEYDSVVDRDMDFDAGSESRVVLLATIPAPFPDPGARISEVEATSTRVLLRGTVGLSSRLDFFLKLGIADLELNYTIKNPTPQADQQIKYDGSVGIAYGAGFKARIVNWGRWVVISDFQFLRYEVEGDYTIDGLDFSAPLLPNLISASTRSKAKVQEFQLAVYIAGKIGMMTPYGGLKISDLMMDIDSKATGIDRTSLSPATESRHEEHKSADHVGAFLGTGLEMNGPWTANIEINFIDETAVSLGINRHF